MIRLVDNGSTLVKPIQHILVVNYAHVQIMVIKLLYSMLQHVVIGYINVLIVALLHVKQQEHVQIMVL